MTDLLAPKPTPLKLYTIPLPEEVLQEIGRLAKEAGVRKTEMARRLMALGLAEGVRQLQERRH